MAEQYVMISMHWDIVFSTLVLYYTSLDVIYITLEECGQPRVGDNVPDLFKSVYS